jgi:hypothetical protein
MRISLLTSFYSEQEDTATLIYLPHKGTDNEIHHHLLGVRLMRGVKSSACA